ncbi:IS630-like element ISWpi10 family transposase [Wolbachia endosymbiont of Tetranychus urticae]|uniref:IS630-like element ISWpi10 family transposase n=1 Tax=Wolbachia endosymbiont of Tetranychus urticae TaxID=169184 RepID=UPI003979BE20
MALRSKLLDEKVVNLAKEMLKKVRNNAYVSKKLQAVIAGKESSISAVARICKISRTALTEWIKHLKFGRVEKLFSPSQRRRKSKLNKNQREQIEIWVERNPNITIKEVQIKISEEFGLNISKSTVHREIQRMKFSYITPRPIHHKQDKNKQEEFKKYFNKIINSHPEKEVFFDESRFGTHSKIGHGWFKKGVRTQVKMKIGRQNFYIYSAVNPRSGKKISLLAPYVNTNCMNIFLEQMSKDLGTKKAFLVMDCAGWHRSKSLKIQKNITIIYLPPYSPELNPVERLWQYIKHNTLRNRVYDTIGLLEDVLCNFIVSISSATIKRVCNVSYLFD